MKKLLTVCLALMLVLTFSLSAAAADYSLTIAGDGVDRPLTLTAAQLAAMPKLTQTFSSVNTYPTEKLYYSQGVSLWTLLERAGLKDEATTVNIAALDADGAVSYNKTLLLSDLLAERYYFDETGNKTPVVPVLALKLGTSADALDDDDLSFLFGQLADTEQTNPYFVSETRLITVSCAPVSQWAPPSYTITRLGDSYYVEFAHANHDVKIYYTTDGSQPTMDSDIFNISAERFQPELNEPIRCAAGDNVIAIAYAPGKQTSRIITVIPGLTEYPFGDAASHWAAGPIEALAAMNIINGFGDTKNGFVFKPEDDLTRAQFAKIMVMALSGGEQPPAAAEVSFSDYTAGAWYASYVEEAVRLGLFTGYEDGSFRPDNPVSQQELIAIVVRALADGEAEALKAAADPRYLGDSSGVSSWARGYVEYALTLKLLPEQIYAQAANDSAAPYTLYGAAKANRATAAYIVYMFLAQ
ncbi:MAG: S-layer homology domain-containing protein [Bacillota bacterium]|nr:S-layer homology domain-containing protein [Bacillota bacterium]